MLQSKSETAVTDVATASLEWPVHWDKSHLHCRPSQHPAKSGAGPPTSCMFSPKVLPELNKRLPSSPDKRSPCDYGIFFLTIMESIFDTVLSVYIWHSKCLYSSTPYLLVLSAYNFKNLKGKEVGEDKYFTRAGYQMLASRLRAARESLLDPSILCFISFWTITIISFCQQTYHFCRQT